MSSGVRQLEREDIPRVAGLFMRILKETGTVPADLISYFDTVYFGTPWLDDDIRSLVYEDDGNIIGFIGAMPRRMCIDGKQIRVAVVGNFMFDDDARTRRSAFGGVEIIRRLIAGPQDLTISDSANDKSRGIWEMCGGVTSHLHSFRWIHMIRPMSYATERWRKKSQSKALSVAATLAAGPIDFAFRKSRGNSKARARGLSTRDLTAADIVAGLPTLTQYDLGPYYEEADLSWLLEMANTKKSRGDLRAKLVNAPDNTSIGWFVYYRNPNGSSQVLQIGAPHKHLDDVFECLLDDAQQSSTSSLTGRLCPTMATYMTSRYCMSVLGAWALMHARDPAIISRFDRGTAMFTGLESEQWLRFVGDFKP